MPVCETDRDWPGLLICVPCEQYVSADIDADATACEHSWDDARDISEFDDEYWAKFRHDVYVKELNRDEPRNRDMVFSEMASLMFDLTMADALPEDYDEREGLERLVVLDADGDADA